MKSFVGKWKMEKSDNFEEYMKAIGVGFALRKLAATAKPEHEVIQRGEDEFTIISKTSFKTSTINFKLGEEFDTETPDGRKVKCVITEEGPDKFKQVEKGEKEITIYRELVDGKYIMTMEYGGVRCVRTYVRA